VIATDLTHEPRQVDHVVAYDTLLQLRLRSGAWSDEQILQRHAPALAVVDMHKRSRVALQLGEK
jgi:hypothetical protein